MRGNGPARNYRLDPHPGAGPQMGLVQAEFRCLQQLQDWLNANDAANECVHGNLPGRPQNVVRCRCWGKSPRAKKKAA